MQLPWNLFNSVVVVPFNAISGFNFFRPRNFCWNLVNLAPNFWFLLLWIFKDGIWKTFNEDLKTCVHALNNNNVLLKITRGGLNMKWGLCRGFASVPCMRFKGRCISSLKTPAWEVRVSLSFPLSSLYFHWTQSLLIGTMYYLKTRC